MFAIMELQLCYKGGRLRGKLHVETCRLSCTKMVFSLGVFHGSFNNFLEPLPDEFKLESFILILAFRKRTRKMNYSIYIHTYNVRYEQCHRILLIFAILMLVLQLKLFIMLGIKWHLSSKHILLCYRLACDRYLVWLELWDILESACIIPDVSL